MTLNGPSERRRRRAAGGGVMPPPQKTLFASGSQGVTAPWSRNLKNASPWIRMLVRGAPTRGHLRSTSAPGGPAMTSKDDIDTASHERQYGPQTTHYRWLGRQVHRSRRDPVLRAVAEIELGGRCSPAAPSS